MSNDTSHAAKSDPVLPAAPAPEADSVGHEPESGAVQPDQVAPSSLATPSIATGAVNMPPTDPNARLSLKRELVCRIQTTLTGARALLCVPTAPTAAEVRRFAEVLKQLNEFMISFLNWQAEPANRKLFIEIGVAARISSAERGSLNPDPWYTFWRAIDVFPLALTATKHEMAINSLALSERGAEILRTATDALEVQLYGLALADIDIQRALDDMANEVFAIAETNLARETEQPLEPATKPTIAAPPAPSSNGSPPVGMTSKCRLKVTIDPPEAELDGNRFRLANHSVAFYLKAMADAPGAWQSSGDIRKRYPEFIAAKPHRLRRGLPSQINLMIEVSAGKGSRIPVEALCEFAP